MAYTIYNVDSISTGVSRNLKDIPVEVLSTGDRAHLKNGNEFSVFVFNSVSVDDEDLVNFPRKIHPADFSSSGVWEEIIPSKNYIDEIKDSLSSDISSKEDSFTKNSAFNKDFGSTTDTVCEGNDYRLSDARTPTTHSHTVTDLPIASQAQMEAGTDSDKIATPLGTKQAIDKQIKSTSWTQDDGLYIATDQIKARDSGGLLLQDDGGNGLTIADGGNITQTSGKYIATDEIRATDSGGLILGDDAGQGMLVNDGGLVTSAYQPSYSAKVTSDIANFSGDNTPYALTGAIFTERHDIGSCLSNGTFTAPISSKKYRHGLNLWLDLSDGTFTLLRVQLVTSNETFPVYYANANASKYATNGYFYETWSLNDIDMDASDTAYWEISVYGATKVADLLAETTIFGGLGV